MTHEIFRSETTGIRTYRRSHLMKVLVRGGYNHIHNAFLMYIVNVRQMDHGCSTHPVMFPPEIFTEIFSFLASEPRVLLACSQAHPIFARLIEPIIYAHVMVTIHEVTSSPTPMAEVKMLREPFMLASTR